VLFVGCDGAPWNDPYPSKDREANTVYSAFQEHPKHLDPARTYSESEWVFICQIYEPPLQYAYLKRPYQLEPLTAASLPEVRYLNQAGEPLAANAPEQEIAYSEYLIRIKPGMYYQQHPAFAQEQNGKYRYYPLSLQAAEQYQVLSEFTERATREVIAEDYVYQIKRLAEPHLSSPIFGLMSRYIVGLEELRAALNVEAKKQDENLEMDLRSYPLKGVEVVDRYTYRIRIHGKYPQFLYWLTMPFFAPIPWEATRFYAQPGLESHNISLDWYPVGTGPFILTVNNPDREMVLEKNPSFRGELYPSDGTKEDKEQGYLENAGTLVPMIDKAVFTIENESIPYWAKFLQGYYDSSGVSSDDFSTAISFNAWGGAELSSELKKQGIQLQTSIGSSIWYWGFNMLDDTVGGYTEKARKLRQAISLALDVDEFILIFMNGRGITASSPIPPDIFGFQVVQDQKQNDLDKARQLLKEAGFSEGLTLYFDTVISGGPEEMATQAWLQKQFAKIGIELVIRGTDYNRFVEKQQLGTLQMYFWGWKADYPDPENFLFLLYGPNSSMKNGGENTSNYQNPVYDSLFEKMRSMANTEERFQIIQQMDEIVRQDMPWMGGFYPKDYVLRHQWISPRKNSAVATNTLKYAKIDPKLRAAKRKMWNQPMVWPLVGLIVLLLLCVVPAFIQYWLRERQKRKG